MEDNSIEVESVNDAVDMQALALLLFGIVAAAAGVVAIGTALSRQLAACGSDSHVLRALGLTRWQRTVAVGMVASPVILIRSAPVNATYRYGEA